MTSYRCEAATTRGHRCRREAKQYRRVPDRGVYREALLCREHEEQRRVGALKLAT